MASVGALRPYGLRRRLPWALGFWLHAPKLPFATARAMVLAHELCLECWHNLLRARGCHMSMRATFRYALACTNQQRGSSPSALSVRHVTALCQTRINEGSGGLARVHFAHQPNWAFNVDACSVQRLRSCLMGAS